MIDYRKNSFNLFRLFAALQVFLGHAISHLDVGYKFKVLNLFPGLPMLFFLSGFLICSSVERTGDIKTYFRKRIFRIYPELWIGVALSVCSILILYNNINWMDLGLFSLTQSSFLQFWTPDSLRGFGCGTPNGSLWTICVIVQFYVVAWFLRDLFKKKLGWLMLAIVSVVVGAITPIINSLFRISIISKLYSQTVIPHFWMFALGATVWLYREKVVAILQKFWWIPLGVLLAEKYVGIIPNIRMSGSYDLFNSLCLFAFAVGFAYKFPCLNIKHDISYGIYIYHMIVINVLIELDVVGTWHAVFLALLVTVVIAIASYFVNSNIKRISGCKYGNQN